MSTRKMPMRSGRHSATRTALSSKGRQLPAATASVLEILERRQLLSTVVFQDHYDTDTTANYTQSDQSPPATQQDSWTVANGTLNYARTDTNGWNTSVFLLKPQVASTAGLSQFATSGDLIAKADSSAGNNYQPGLIVSGDTTNGGFVVMEYDNGAFTNHLVLLQETGAQLVGDEGGTGNPPVLADLADLTNGNTDDTFHVVANVDRSGSNPVIKVDITDLTDPTFIIPSQTITDTNVPSTFGGTQIGWRARYDAPANFSVDNLELDNTIPGATHAPAAPTNLQATQGAGTSVNLTFTNNADNALNFIIEKSTDGTNFTQVGSAASVAQGATVNFTDNSANAPGTTASYRVRAFNGFNGGTTSDPSNVASVTILAPTSGVKETLYNQAFWAGSPVDTRFVSAADYSDGNGTAGDPSKITNTSENSVVFSGRIKITTPGTYTFVSNTSNDGFLYVDGTLVSSDPGDHPQQDATTLVPLNMTAGNHDFVFLQTWARYVGQDGSQGAHLEWITPGTSSAVLIPSSNLLATSDTPSAPNAPTVSKSDAHAIDLTFTANNSGVVHYLLQRSGDGGKTWTDLSLIDPGDNGQTNGTAGTSATIQAEDAFPVQGATYQYRVISQGADGASAPGAASASVAVPANPISATTAGVEEHDYRAELWKTQDPTGPAAVPKSLGQPDEFQLVTTGDATSGGGIDVALAGDASPDLTPYPTVQRIHPISFSNVFTGKIKTDDAGVYTFITNSDDDGYLYVNDVLVSQDPGGHGPQEATQLIPVTLAAKTSYNFIFLFNQRAGGAAYHVQWIEPNAAEAPIPLASDTAGGFLALSDTPHQQTIDANGTVTDTATGSAAGNLTVAAVAGGPGATLTWTDQSFSEIAYDIQRSTDGGATFSVVGTAGLNQTTFTDPGGTAGAVYKVRGINYDGAGPFSNTATLAGGTQFNKADFNHSGKVDFADLLILAQNYGKAADSTHGDTNGDGKVDFSDLLFLAQNYGKTGPQAAKTRGSLLSDVVGLVKTH